MVIRLIPLTMDCFTRKGFPLETTNEFAVRYMYEEDNIQELTESHSMFCKVFNTDDNTVIMINPNCNMKLIYEYLRVMTDIPDSHEIDLCTDTGQLMGIYEAPCSSNGLEHFKPRSDYFIFIFDYDESGVLYNPRPSVPYDSNLFAPVLKAMKKFFGIPKSEPVSEEDAMLLFEHVLIAYQDKLAPVTARDSMASVGAADVPPVRRNSRNKSNLRAHVSIFHTWREEKREAMMAALSEVEENEQTTEDLGALVARRLSRMSIQMHKNNHLELNGEDADQEMMEEPSIKKLPATKKGTSKKSDKKGSKKEVQDGDRRIPPKEKEKLQQAAPTVRASSLLEPVNSLTSIRQFFKSQPMQMRDRPKFPAKLESESKIDKKGKVGRRRKLAITKRGNLKRK